MGFDGKIIRFDEGDKDMKKEKSIAALLQICQTTFNEFVRL